MLKANCVLKRFWQSRLGIQEELYLGYNENNKLDCITDLPKAKKMTLEECEEFKTMLLNSKVWVIDVLPEEFNQDQKEITKENNDAD